MHPKNRLKDAPSAKQKAAFGQLFSFKINNLHIGYDIIEASHQGVVMGWHIEVMENQLRLSMAQAERLVDLLESTWDEYPEYLSWLGDKAALVEFFGGERLEFIDDFMEHMDYLRNEGMQAALVAVGARGFVTLGDFEGDARGYAWTHEFTDAGYAHGVGKVRLMANGKMPVEIQTPKIEVAALAALAPRAPFDGNSFVVTGNFDALPRETILAAISRMGGSAHGSVSGKTFALIAGSEPGPAKIAKAAERGITVWDEETFLVQAGLKVGAVPPVAPIVAATESTGFNTLSYKKLCEAFEQVVDEYGGSVHHGLFHSGPKLEDGLPWFEVEFACKMSTTWAKEFCQALARAMNVRVLFNRVEGKTGDWAVLGCFDFDPDCLRHAQVPAYSRTEDGAEFMEDYGTPFLPNAPVRKPKTKASAVDTVPARTPYGWHYEEYHVASGEVVRDGFSRVDITGMTSKIKGFAFRFTALFTD